MAPIKWFDENDKEFDPVPANISKQEIVAEVGGTFDEFIVCINFFSEQLDKDEITNLLGIQPTKAWNNGEKHQIGNSNKTRITDWGKWYLKMKPSSQDINFQITELLESLCPDNKTWEMLTSKYKSWIDVSGYMENWNRGFMLNKETMNKLVERNLEIYFDIYYYPEE